MWLKITWLPMKVGQAFDKCRNVRVHLVLMLFGVVGRIYRAYKAPLDAILVDVRLCEEVETSPAVRCERLWKKKSD